MRRRATALTATAVLVAGTVLTGPAAPATAAPPPPGTPEPGPTRYLIRTDSTAVADDVAGTVRAAGGDVDTVYDRVLPGLSATLTPDQAARLRSDGAVQAVVPDGVVHATAIQDGPTWGLDRIDQRTAKASGAYRYRTTGAGVTAFVLDTGIRFHHTEFGGRAVSGHDFVDGGKAGDCEGHGTHVAGTIGGSTYGVAKKVRLVSVRVLDCKGQGAISDIIDALDWVVAHKPSGPAVVNLSLGGDPYPLLDQAVARTVAAGVPVVVAAGNDGVDACEESPARAKAALTVAATDRHDARADWSNFGRCVDLFAPGVGIRSAFNTSNTATEVMSGTSMAAPHVTGALARYLQTHPRATATQADAALLADATTGVVRSRASSPNRLLHVSRPKTAPGLPALVAAHRHSSPRTLTLSWAPPRDDGGRSVSGYVVTRSGTDAKGRGPVTVRVGGSTRSWQTTALPAGRSYTLTVRAVNAEGEGGAVTVKATTG